MTQSTKYLNNSFVYQFGENYREVQYNNYINKLRKSNRNYQRKVTILKIFLNEKL